MEWISQLTNLIKPEAGLSIVTGLIGLFAMFVFFKVSRLIFRVAIILTVSFFVLVGFVGGGLYLYNNPESLNIVNLDQFAELLKSVSFH